MINTLAALLGALTVGTILLMVMETAPIRPDITSLIASSATANDPVEIIRQTDIPIQMIKWRNIVIHSASAQERSIIDKCHFVIEPDASQHSGRIRATKLWKRQDHRYYIARPNSGFCENSIAVCIIGDFNRVSPSSKQMSDALSLVQALQFEFQISRGHVYLHRNLDSTSRSPGRNFPADWFNGQLLRASR